MRKTAITLCIAVLLTGCAGPGAYRRPDIGRGIPRTSISGVKYVRAKELSDAYSADWHWDSTAKIFTLTKSSNQAKVMVNSPLVYINGELVSLGADVRLHNGELLIPADIIPNVMNKFFIAAYYARRPRRPIRAAGRAVPKGRLHHIDTIVIDAGHGGKDPGAIGKAGTYEKRIVLDVAKRLKKHLGENGIRVLMTRDKDRFISLSQRARIANTKDAALFVSLHANASRRRSMNGFEVYYFSEATDDSARALAAAENIALGAEGKNLINPSTDLKAIIWDMKYSEYRAQSIGLARAISASVSRGVSTRNRGIKSARFYVLKHTRMPAVLVEMGYISNRYEERKLNSGSYRERMADALSKGILAYADEYAKKEGFAN